MLKKKQHFSGFRLYITDVPEASLAENTNFTVVYRSKKDDSPTPELLDVLVGEIEIACDIVSTELLLVPPQMILPIELQYVNTLYLVIKQLPIFQQAERIDNERSKYFH